MKIGIIGYGAMGGYHADRLKKSPLELVGAYDNDIKSLRKAENDGVKAFSTFESLAECVDAVLIATPNDSHMQYAIESAKAKKHIICEKPAAMETEQFRLMKKVSKDNGVILMVHQNRRFDNDYLLLKQIIKSGVLGEVYKIESRVMAANGIPGAWRKCKSNGGGMMLDWGVHLIDQAFLVMDCQNVYSHYSYVLNEEVEDGFGIFMQGEGKFDNLSKEMRFSVEVDTNCFIPLPRWRVYGTLGACQIDNWELEGKIVAKNDNPNIITAIKAGNGLTKTMAERNADSVETFSLPFLTETPKDFYQLFEKAVLTGKSEIKNSEIEKVLDFITKLNREKQKK